jgi:hypothetical protein
MDEDVGGNIKNIKHTKVQNCGSTLEPSMSNIQSIVIIFRQLSIFVILCCMLQCLCSYPGAIRPFGAIVKLQRLVTCSAAEFVLGNWRSANTSVPFFYKWVPGLHSLNVFLDVGA